MPTTPATAADPTASHQPLPLACKGWVRGGAFRREVETASPPALDEALADKGCLQGTQRFGTGTC
eukprot:1161293-Pelagomonas_calceolata.AAC.10